MTTIIQSRLEALRTEMRREKVGAVIITSQDPHGSEYVADRWTGRAWISGFNGSAGTAVITLGKAAVWTDSRYFIAAAEQLQGTGFTLMKDGLPDTPTIAEWIGSQIDELEYTDVLTDGWCMSRNEADNLRQELQKNKGFTLRTNMDLLNRIWTDRPAVPHGPIVNHPIEYSGKKAEHKLEELRRELRKMHADGMLVSQLDDIAWILNLRGCDVHCNPVFMAYLLVGETDATLYVNEGSLSQTAKTSLTEAGVKTADYSKVEEGLRRYAHYNILLDPASTSIHNSQLVSHNAKCNIVEATSPIPAMKAVKNETELNGFRRSMERDGVAMVRFLMWLKDAVKTEHVTEITADEKLTELKKQWPEYRGASFDTIMAYGAHGAIVHYEATPETDIPLQPRGMVLLDHGTQYADGTTDCTRTIVLGPLTDEEKRVYTLVLKGHLALQDVKFPSGASGTQIDAFAREAIWREGMNYGHGTGHGVGAYLNVHEGPHQVRMQWRPAPIKAGMTLTDEPGLYLEGRFGVRIENTIAARTYKVTEFGEFLEFEPLTLCPIDKEAIDMTMMTERDKQLLNSYHAMVYEKLAPSLNETERQWLAEATAAI